MESRAQKIVDITSQSPVAFELLASPSPDVLAGRGLEQFFASITISEACAWFTHQLKDAERLFDATGIASSINLNGHVLNDLGCSDQLMSLIANLTHPVTLEFTETTPMPPCEPTNLLLSELMDHGVMASLDDFGTGLNGMSILMDYNFHYIKFDKIFLSGIEERKQKWKILESMAELIRSLGKISVIEGVETKEQCEIVKSLGFDRAQGYYFHRPEPVEAILQSLSGRGEA